MDKDQNKDYYKFDDNQMNSYADDSNDLVQQFLNNLNDNPSPPVPNDTNNDIDPNVENKQLESDEAIPYWAEQANEFRVLESPESPLQHPEPSLASAPLPAAPAFAGPVNLPVQPSPVQDDLQTKYNTPGIFHQDFKPGHYGTRKKISPISVLGNYGYFDEREKRKGKATLGLANRCNVNPINSITEKLMQTDISTFPSSLNYQQMASSNTFDDPLSPFSIVSDTPTPTTSFPLLDENNHLLPLNFYLRSRPQRTTPFYGISKTRTTTRRKKKLYTHALPSKHCHLCCRRPTKKSPHLRCGNIMKKECRKVICKRCFASNGWDWNKAVKKGPAYVCCHCAERCPKKSSCSNYNKTNGKRKRLSGPMKVDLFFDTAGAC